MNMFAALQGESWEEVPQSAELERILALPRRQWPDAALKAIKASIDPRVTKPSGTMSLFQAQAQALYELEQGDGVFCPLEIGFGKTLVGFLAPLFTRSSRPLLLVPAGLRDKTYRDQKRYAEHFWIPNYLRIESYETLSRNRDLLSEYRPDLIIADEGHALKNKKAGCTKHLIWFMEDSPATRFVLMSGTVTTKSILEYAHLLQLCLRFRSPLPMHYKDLCTWARHLDKRDNRIGLGALRRLCSDEELRGPEPARRAYQRRLVDTFGVISSGEQTDGYAGGLIFNFERVETPEILSGELSAMRNSWKTPNGEKFDDALEMYRHVREMACGFYLHWDPLPPEKWLQARADWHEVRNHILKYNMRRLATPMQVAQAVDSGHYPEAVEKLEEWRRVKETYKYKTIPAWLSGFLVEHITNYVKRKPPTLVWVNQVALGERLAEISGMPYYAGQGLDKNGKSIEVDPGGRSVIVSVQANLQGRNLQDRWSRNLLVNPPSQAKALEQLVGRTHRRGQEADEVFCDVIITCLEHEYALQNALAEARYVKQTLGQPNKLLVADFAQPFTHPYVG